jgi:GntR family transcriptional regulator, arabinose operon transcriptional repressor
MASSSHKSSSRLPAYLHIAQLLRERIAMGEYRADEYLPSENRLAKEFSVSRQTVRLALDALSEEGLVAAEQGRGTRILGVNTEVKKQSDHLQLVALIISGTAGLGSLVTFQGCHATLQKAGYHLIVCDSSLDSTHESGTETDHLRALVDKGVRGIILFSTPTDQNRLLLEEGLARGVHIVQIDRYLPGLECDYVGVDNVAAAAEMVDHLWRLGHRHIAFLSAEDELSTCQELLQGYQIALREHGLPNLDQELIAYRSSWEPEENQVRHFIHRRLNLPDPADTFVVNDAVAAHVHRWLALPNPPSAIFAVSDAIALHVIEAARQQGKRVPEDVAVVGVDDLPFAAYLSSPLTTVRQPFRAIGETAAELLLARMTGRYQNAPRRVRLPAELVIRESCGAGAHVRRASSVFRS